MTRKPIHPTYRLQDGASLSGSASADQERVYTLLQQAPQSAHSISLGLGMPLSDAQLILSHFQRAGTIECINPEAETEGHTSHAAPREIYRSRLRYLNEAERAHGAMTADVSLLLAYCFDPSPTVLNSVVDNPSFGFPHARLIAQNAPSTKGLRVLVAHRAILNDAQVLQNLLRNSMTPPTLLDACPLISTPEQVWTKWARRDAAERNRLYLEQRLCKLFTQLSTSKQMRFWVKTRGRPLRVLKKIPVPRRLVMLINQQTNLPKDTLEAFRKWEKGTSH